jgi:hypothetical protein
MGLKIRLFRSATVAKDVQNMKATKSKMVLGINCVVTVVLLRETIRDAEEKSGLPRPSVSRISLTGLKRFELSSLGRFQFLQMLPLETVSITMILIPMHMNC